MISKIIATTTFTLAAAAVAGVNGIPLETQANGKPNVAIESQVDEFTLN